ncbi:MAG TPA: MFS transporter [Coleofasciculaceae cyanobacterium]|jgi:MFS family permease
MNPPKKLIAGLPQFDRRIWILIAGRLLSQMGSGFVLFYAPIFFVNQVGLSAAAVGIGIGSESISGVFGRILGGSLADSPQWGRRKTLLLSAAISALADLVLTFSYNFPTFLLGNLLMGLGIGLYWPATEAVVADLASLEHRNEAFALNRLADSLGLSLGVVLGGALIAMTGSYRALFVIDGISFLVLLAIVYKAIAETLNPAQVGKPGWQGWVKALRDRPLLVYVLANVLFTTYLAFVSSTLPLYLTNFVSERAQQPGFTPVVISALFTWHVALAALCQLPAARWLNRFSRPKALMLSAGLWAIGFGLVWVTGTAAADHLAWAALTLAVMALATVSYTPAASSLVVGLAPNSARGVYLSINSLCWAVGYFVGPVMGGWAMDQSRSIATGFWVAVALSVIGAIGVLLWLDRLLDKAKMERSQV